MKYRTQMKINLRELKELITVSDFPNGYFSKEYVLPDGRKIQMEGFVDKNGYIPYYYENEPVFNGIIDFMLKNVKGYDSEGNIIPVEGASWFVGYMIDLLNSNK